MSNMDLMDRLLATIRIRIPTVTAQALNLELFNTIDEFFRGSNAWRWGSAVPLDPGLMQYPLFPPAGSDLVQVMGVEYRGSPVNPIATDPDGTTINTQRGRISGEAVPPDYDTTFEPNVTVSPGGVFQYAVYFPRYITIDIPPSEAAAEFPLNVLLALTLNYQCLEDDPNEWPLEEWMFGTFHEAWAEGVQGRLMSQISKPYSSPAMAQYHMKRFRKFTARAKQTAERGYVFDKPVWRFPRWA